MPKTKTIKLDSRLTEQEKRNIVQAATNIMLEGMIPSEQCIRDMEAVALGEMTEEQMIQETIRRYKK